MDISSYIIKDNRILLKDLPDSGLIIKHRYLREKLIKEIGKGYEMFGGILKHVCHLEGQISFENIDYKNLSFDCVDESGQSIKTFLNFDYVYPYFAFIKDGITRVYKFSYGTRKDYLELNLENNIFDNGTVKLYRDTSLLSNFKLVNNNSLTEISVTKKDNPNDSSIILPQEGQLINWLMANPSNDIISLFDKTVSIIGSSDDYEWMQFRITKSDHPIITSTFPMYTGFLEKEPELSGLIVLRHNKLARFKMAKKGYNIQYGGARFSVNHTELKDIDQSYKNAIEDSAPFIKRASQFVKRFKQ